jgi:acyl-CoA dehydrogenase
LEPAVAFPISYPTAGAALLWRGKIKAGDWVLVHGAAGGVGLGFSDVAPLMEVLGRHAAPVPLAEGIFANALLSASGITPPQGVISFGAGQGAIPWGRHASHIALLDGARIALYPAAALAWEVGGNIAHEARDRARIIGAPVAEAVP